MRPRHPQSPKLPTGALYALAVVAGVVAAGVGYATLNQPLVEWRRGVSERAGLVREKLAEGPRLRTQHAEQKRQLADLLERVELVNRRVPDGPQEGEFLADLSRLAETYGVTIEDFRRGATAEAPTHSMVAVTVSVRGPHAGLVRLLDGVANLQRLAELTHLEIDSNAAGGDYPARLSYSLYYGMAATPADSPAT